ncbi:neurogenic locus notch homolog protein 1-like isoform X1 [Dendronephthya gigantea]|uniref:neurogenic locus notch homolog protein 1-like isoform X1 n=1 Tax=Dendronephthya gigantea TaxID=151771 RepID=UPI00106DBDF5|nr:neurogenic locus notch homolog protein 1-like isoform X1 [Dendronephthya gigantea]
MVNCSCQRGFKGINCTDVNKCEINPCRNGGTCIQLEKNQFFCKCLPEYNGTFCRKRNRCLVHVNPCRNGGICSTDEKKPVCSCREGFVSEFCQDHVCKPSPCLHGGVCKAKAKGQTWEFQCSCPKSFTGKICQVASPCMSKPCMHGRCIDATNDPRYTRLTGGYLCLCEKGYTGKNCRKKICDSCHKNAKCQGGHCVCKPGFIGNGLTCKSVYKTGPCALKPCRNNGVCVNMDETTYDCRCSAKYTGRNCETRLKCVPNPCKHGGVCFESGKTFRCVCQKNFTGKDCSKRVVIKDRCSPNPCKYNGKCRTSEDGTRAFCKCPTYKFKPPFCDCDCPKANPLRQRNSINSFCDKKGDCICPRSKMYLTPWGCVPSVLSELDNPCSVKPCRNNGTCFNFSISPLTQNDRSYRCRCAIGFTGSRCEIKLPDPCLRNPCRNGGVCKASKGVAVCHCKSGYVRPYCLRPPPGVSKCYPNPCLYDGECFEKDGRYSCKCKKHFTGTHCQIFMDDCKDCNSKFAHCFRGKCVCKPGYVGNGKVCAPSLSVNPCQNSGIILHTPGGFECLCKKQYKGKHCEARNYCYPNPCVNRGNCVETKHSFVCKCLKGFKGATCSEKDPCALNICKHGGTCIDVGGSKVQCSCPIGFKGNTCGEIEYCDPNPCLHGGTCKESNGKFVCACVQDWRGSICEIPHRCLVNPCRNGGQCIEGQTATMCKCKEGFYGTFCQDHVCLPNPCFNKGECSVVVKPDKTWTYKCQCQPTFKGERCQVRNRCALNLCKNGVCIDDSSKYHVDLPLNGYLCICKDGFKGENCDRNVCDNCHKDAVCLYGQCICKNGFVGNGKTCKKSSDICSPNPCKNGAKCVHAPKDSFDCVCVRGFTGPLCESVTLCDPNPCKNGATCVAAAGKYTCICPQGKAGPDCEEIKKIKCTPTFCQYGGICKEPEDPTKPPFCICKTHKFVPPNCACACAPANKNVDSSAVDPVCDADGDCVCADASKTFVTGTGCTVGKTDPCLNLLCQNGGTKERAGSTCICRCPTGYTGARCETKTGRQCIPNPCKNQGTCEESLGRIKCNCLQGFRQPFCEPETIANFKPCVQNPCKNGGRCLALKNGYDCQCSPQYTGPHCEVDKCLKCHKDAYCIQGVCTCKENFVGNGYNCIVELEKSDSSCYKCPVNTVCNLGVCECRHGYVMQKRNCIPITV